MENYCLERSDTLPLISNNQFERGDTMPLYPDDQFQNLFDGNTSFNDQFATVDMADILRSPESIVTEKENDLKQMSIWNSFNENDYKGKKFVELDDGIMFCTKHDEGTTSEVNFESKEDASTVIFINDDKAAIVPLIADGVASLSLLPMPGLYNFSLKLHSNMHNNNKWCFSNSLNKLFVQNLIAVPVDVVVDHWNDSYVNITPVFVESQDQASPVTRCFNHQKLDEDKNLAYAKHIVQVENPDAKYKFTNNRHSVDIPLGIPPPGEKSKTLFVKCGCWNTCVGGPDRKRFSLVFTLFDSNHMEIGRQVVTLKVCSCPKRDMEQDERKQATLKKKSPSKRLINTGKKLTSKKIKIEAHDNLTTKYEQLRIPVEFVPKVKAYLNQLAAEKIVKQNVNSALQLPYPNL